MTMLPPTADDVATRNRARILVIDDDGAFRNLLVAILRRNYIVSVASDGLSGFNKAKENPPDIAVIDIQMPGWDGLQTLAAFRQEPSLSQTATMILTADASRGTVLAAVQGGANDYVIKTAFSREDFERKIERLLRKSSAPRSPKSQLHPQDTPRSSATGAVSAIPNSNHAPMLPQSVALPGTTDQISDEISPPRPIEPFAVSRPTAPAADLQEMLDSWD